MLLQAALFFASCLFFSFISVNKRNRKLLLRQMPTTDNARADSLSLSLSLILSLHSLQNGMEGPCAGHSSRVIQRACGQFWGPSEINHCCVRFHRDMKIIDPYAFWGTAVYVFTGT